ncbi:MAG: DegV family protein, partial [Oscillospiraceae bacterium]|nr:DegV family protein [Oscillospiraceae bacterium]
MGGFIITADSCSDFNEHFKEKYDARILSLHCFLNEKPFEGEGNDLKKFYNSMRNGVSASTSMVNVKDARTFFEGFLKAGLDVIHIACPPFISGTIESCRTAEAELRADYPENKVR